jgi:chemotaxis protein methyltransferase CheR
MIAAAAPVLRRETFDRVRRIAYDYCGLAIDETKTLLVSSRLLKVMREQNIPTYEAYLDLVAGDSTQNALVAMIDVLTTNYTNFFREPKHFEFLEEVLWPSLARRAEITVWSAACSTGEEPYSLAMAVREHFAQGGPRVRILATDISTRVLAAAAEGIYPERSFDKLDPGYLRRHLLKGAGSAAGQFRFRPEVRQMISFQRFNLTKPFPSGVGRFPLILCRNVMIYFDVPTQERLIRQFQQHLEPGGYLFVGHSESLNNLQHGLEYVRPAVYRKPAA